MDFKLSSRTRRLFASWIDGIVSMLFSKIGLLLFGLSNEEYLDTFLYSSISMCLFTLLILGITIMLNIIIPTYIWNGQTIGKRILKIQVVKDSNDRVDIKTITLRSFYLIGVLNLPTITVVFSVISIIDILFIFRKDKKTLHDLIAKTKVVYY
ncbi:RDD family protein [Bacillus sp. EAC]|uniref:RDD family protein n=1 Tax=Bacillus sp. EAC TaxID=1978338 RepID=UPI000B44E523|nr:RDD family protein [Bacillus sp. EAC]